VLPLPAVPGQAVKQQHGPAIATEVPPDKRHPVTDNRKPPRHNRDATGSSPQRRRYGDSPRRGHNASNFSGAPSRSHADLVPFSRRSWPRPHHHALGDQRDVPFGAHYVGER
jgi:hypothetical protein